MDLLPLYCNNAESSELFKGICLSMPARGLMQVFRAVKSRFYVMPDKRKPSDTLGQIIKLLVIAKLALTILHLLKC
jgi:hypothetical protein